MEDVVLRALAKEPAERFPDIQAFAIAFQVAFEGPFKKRYEPISERPVLNSVQRGHTPLRRILANQVTPMLKQAQTFLVQGRFNDAIDLCEQIVDSGIYRPDAYYFLGWLYQEQQRWDDAIRRLQFVLNDPDYALSGYYALGQCYRAKGDMRTAAVHFDEAVDRVNLDALTVEESDQLVQLCQETAEAHRLLGEQEQALTVYNALLGFLLSRGWNDKVAQVEFMLQQMRNTPIHPSIGLIQSTQSDVNELPGWLKRLGSDAASMSVANRPPQIQSVSPNVDIGDASPNRFDQIIKELFQEKNQAYLKVDVGRDVGRIYEITKDLIQIGREPSRDIFLEDLAVTRLHASIFKDSNYSIRDENSANGTKLNELLLMKHRPYPLQDGDRIKIGLTELLFLVKTIEVNDRNSMNNTMCI